MHVGMVIEMASDSLAERVAVGPLEGGITFGELGARARRAGTWLRSSPGDRIGRSAAKEREAGVRR